MKSYLTFLLIFVFQILNAQYLEQIEAEEYTDYGIVDYSIMHNGAIYTSGKANDNGDLVQPYIRKLDTNGNIIWSTTSKDNEASSSRVREVYHSSDGFLYGFSYPPSINGIHQIWKIDTLSGDIIYKYDMDLVYSDLSDFNDYNGDTLLFSFDTYIAGDGKYHLAYFDKAQGILLSYAEIPSGASKFILPDNNTIFYTGRDTIFKTTPTNVDVPTWKTNVITTGGNVSFDEIYYNETTDLVYALGSVSTSAKGIVSCFDAQNGDLLWSVKTESFDDVRYQDYEVDGNNMYISWQHAYHGGGTYHAIIDKINLTTGDIIWEIEGEYEDGNEGEQAALDLEIDDNYVYLTGYYNAGNYGPGDWGVMKLSKMSGIKFSSTTISNTEFDHSEGIAIFPLENKIICIGYLGTQNFSKELFVELNSASEIIKKKEIGGTTMLASATTAIDQLANGKIVVLQQKGRYGHISIRDVQGNIEWDSVMLFNSAFNASALSVENDSLILMAGISTVNRINIIGINPITHQVVFTTTKSPSNYDLKVLDILYKHEETIIVSTLDDDGGTNLYRFYYNTNNGKWLSSNPEYGASLISSSYSDRFTNSNLTIDVSENSHLLLRSSGWNELSNDNLDNLGSHSANDFYSYSHPNVIQDSLIIFTGVAYNTNNLGVIRVNRSTLEASNTYEFTDFQATGIKWVQGENDSYIYILSEDNSDVFVTKFDIDNQEAIWTTSASSGNTNFPFIFATDIAYNSTENYITATGFRENLAGDDKQVFFSLISSDGTVIADVSRDGDKAGENMGLTLTSHNNSGTSLIGGQINKDTSVSSAFIYYLNESNLINAIKGKVFLDNDENGIQNSGEPNIAVGNINIDNEYETYLNQNGFFQTIPNPGWHTVTYNLDSDWALTSDSLTFHLDTNDPGTPNDTLCFGIKPENIVDQVEPFVLAQAFVCNLSTPFLLQIRNTGTTVQDVILKFNFEGFLEGSTPTPDSINVNNLYWTYNGLNPGESRIIELRIQMPGVDEIGETLSFNAFAYLFDSNSQTITDSFEYEYQDILLCAYDPNDKHVNPMGVGDDDLTLFGQYLNYTVRFQNTGNFPAKDVIIADTLDDDLDLSTFEFLAASHTISEINKRDNAFEFVFNNIFLPDSLSNEPESHGFVSFRIKPKEGLPEGTKINNTAYIYFDQNPAIITNKTRNILVSDLTPTIQIQDDKNVLYKVFPNPTTGELFVESLYASPNPINWNLIDILGRRIKSGNLERNQQRLNLNEIKNGIYFLDLNQEATFKIIITD